MDRQEQLARLLEAQQDRRERRELAVTSGGSGFGVSYAIFESDLPLARRLAESYENINQRSGLIGAVQRAVQSKRLERKLSAMLVQEITGNQQVAEIDMESGLWEPYNPYDDRQLLAKICAKGALEGTLTLLSDPLEF